MVESKGEPGSAVKMGGHCLITDADILDPMNCPRPETTSLQASSLSAHHARFEVDTSLEMHQKSKREHNWLCDDSSKGVGPSNHQISSEEKPLDTEISSNCTQIQLVDHKQSDDAVKAKHHPEMPQPRHGLLEEALMSLKPLMASSQKLSSPSLGFRNGWLILRRIPVDKDQTRFEWKCVSSDFYIV